MVCFAVCGSYCLSMMHSLCKGLKHGFITWRLFLKNICKWRDDDAAATDEPQFRNGLRQKIPPHNNGYGIPAGRPIPHTDWADRGSLQAAETSLCKYFFGDHFRILAAHVCDHKQVIFGAQMGFDVFKQATCHFQNVGTSL